MGCCNAVGADASTDNKEETNVEADAITEPEKNEERSADAPERVQSDDEAVSTDAVQCSPDKTDSETAQAAMDLLDRQKREDEGTKEMKDVALTAEDSPQTQTKMRVPQMHTVQSSTDFEGSEMMELESTMLTIIDHMKTNEQ